ncbi:MAG: ribose-5-phosphate isomerase RpiA [Alphaproteobacteria bacterium]|nr:ribose-5-phosphate isomerase RpiA [Alphaproteobacteria bacterium]
MQDFARYYKRQVAAAGVELVESGMVVGLGSGSTAEVMIELLAERVAQEGLDIAAIATSVNSANLAEKLGIRLVSFDQYVSIDLTLDGADEIHPTRLDLIKGLGAALWREKIVAACSDRLVILADESKIVSYLGERSPVPVEVAQFGWQTTRHHIMELFDGAEAELRQKAGKPLVTDGGNYILDCRFGEIAEPEELDMLLTTLPGVVVTGIFCRFAEHAIVAGEKGVRMIEPVHIDYDPHDVGMA